jgi:hypothetical protein
MKLAEYNPWCFTCGHPTESNENRLRCKHCHSKQPTGIWKQIRARSQCYWISRRLLREEWPPEVQFLMSCFGKRSLRRLVRRCGPQTEYVLRYAIPAIHTKIATECDFLNWRLLREGLRIAATALPAPYEKERSYDAVAAPHNHYEGGYSDADPIRFVEGSPGHEGGSDKWTIDPAEKERQGMAWAESYLNFAFDPIAQSLRAVVEAWGMPCPRGGLPLEEIGAELDKSGATLNDLMQFLLHDFGGSSSDKIRGDGIEEITWSYVIKSVRTWAAPRKYKRDTWRLSFVRRLPTPELAVVEEAMSKGDHSKAREEVLAIALQGNPVAQLMLGFVNDQDILLYTRTESGLMVPHSALEPPASLLPWRCGLVRHRRHRRGAWWKMSGRM